MNKSGLSYLKLTALVAVLAITLIGLSGLFGVTTMAQDNETAKREIDLREKLKDKKFNDGRRVEIHALNTGEKVLAEVKDGKFVNLYLVATDGTEVKGVFKKDQKSTTNTDVCSATITTTTKERKGLHMITITTTTVVQFPCVSSPAS